MCAHVNGTATNLHLQTCVSMLGGATATISTLNWLCVLMSMLGGGGMGGSSWDYRGGTVQSPPSNVCAHVNGTSTISTFKPVCVLMSMLGGATATISTLKRLCVCSCQCLGVEEWEDLLGTIKGRRSSFLNRSFKSTKVSVCS